MKKKQSTTDRRHKQLRADIKQLHAKVVYLDDRLMEALATISDLIEVIREISGRGSGIVQAEPHSEPAEKSVTVVDGRGREHTVKDGKVVRT